MELIKSSNINVEKCDYKQSQKYLFDFVDIDAYLELMRFAVDVDSIKSSRVLLVLTSINSGYKVYRGDYVYNEKLRIVYNILKKHSSFFKEKKKDLSVQYYCILKREDFLKYENILFETCLLFRFSAFLGLKDNVENSEILKILNKFSVHSVLSFERWREIVEWILFFDGEHFAGSLIISNKN